MIKTLQFHLNAFAGIRNIRMVEIKEGLLVESDRDTEKLKFDFRVVTVPLSRMPHWGFAVGTSPESMLCRGERGMVSGLSGTEEETDLPVTSRVFIF